MEVDPAGAPALVAGDPVRLRQVVDNLVSNALRYSPQDRPALLRVSTMSARDAAAVGEPAGSTGVLQVDPAAPLAVLDVIDRGPGMPDEVAARVFERFYREDRARSRDHGGAGLGLAIVSAITAAHGGRVEVRTHPGRGAAFRLLLPLLMVPPTSIEPPADALPPAAGGRSPSPAEPALPAAGVATEGAPAGQPPDQAPTAV